MTYCEVTATLRVLSCWQVWDVSTLLQQIRFDSMALTSLWLVNGFIIWRGFRDLRPRCYIYAGVICDAHFISERRPGARKLLLLNLEIEAGLTEKSAAGIARFIEVRIACAWRKDAYCVWAALQWVLFTILFILQNSRYNTMAKSRSFDVDLLPCFDHFDQFAGSHLDVWEKLLHLNRLLLCMSASAQRRIL